MGEYVKLSLEHYERLKDKQETTEHIEETYDYLTKMMSNSHKVTGQEVDGLNRELVVYLDEHRLRDLFRATVGMDQTLDFELKFVIDRG